MAANASGNAVTEESCSRCLPLPRYVIADGLDRVETPTNSRNAFNQSATFEPPNCDVGKFWDPNKVAKAIGIDRQRFHCAPRS